MPKTQDPFNFIAETPDTVTTYQDEIRFKVSVDWCTKHPTNDDIYYAQGPPAQQSNNVRSQDANATPMPISIDATEEHDVFDSPDALADAASPRLIPPTSTSVLSRLVQHAYVGDKAVYTGLYTDGSPRSLQMHEVDPKALTQYWRKTATNRLSL